MKTNFLGLLLVVFLVPLLLIILSSVSRRMGYPRPSELVNTLLAGPLGVLTVVLFEFAGVSLVTPYLVAFVGGMAGYCAREMLRQVWRNFGPCQLGLYSCVLVLALVGSGCAGLGHRSNSDDKEFAQDKGKIIEFGKAGQFTLFGYYGNVKRTTDEKALSGATGVFADKSMQGFSAETTGIKGNTRKYGIQSYESKIRADAITAALDPLKGIVSDVVRAYLAGPLGDVWAGAATTEEKLAKSAEIAKDDPKAPEGTVDELKAALEKLK